jgi:hypothetical protein
MAALDASSTVPETTPLPVCANKGTAKARLNRSFFTIVKLTPKFRSDSG